MKKLLAPLIAGMLAYSSAYADEAITSGTESLVELCNTHLTERTRWTKDNDMYQLRVGDMEVLVYDFYDGETSDKVKIVSPEIWATYQDGEITSLLTKHPKGRMWQRAKLDEESEPYLKAKAVLTRANLELSKKYTK